MSSRSRPGVSEDIESFTTRGNYRSQIIFKSSVSPRVLETHAKRFKNKGLCRSCSELFLSLFFLCSFSFFISGHCRYFWLSSQKILASMFVWDNHKDENQLCFFHSSHSNYVFFFPPQYDFALCLPLLQAMFPHLYLSPLSVFLPSWGR